ncbi:MAG: TolC family protein [Pseudomonadota bacterium]
MFLNFFRWAVVFGATLGLGTHAVQANDLSAAVRNALTSNPALQADDARLRAEAQDLLSRIGGYQPTLSAFGSFGSEYVDDPNGLPATDNAISKPPRDVGLIVDLPLYDGNRRANQVFGQAARMDQTLYTYLDASETMALSIVQAYIDIARQHQLNAVTEDHIGRQQNIVRQVQEQVAGGRLPLSDQIQAESRVQDLRVTLTQGQRDLYRAQSRFKELVGYGPKSVTKMPNLRTPPKSLQAFVQSAFANNYRLKAAQSNIDVREFERRAAEADYLPQVSLNATAATGQDLDGSYGSESRAYVGVNLNWEISSGGRRERRQSLVERRSAALYDRMAIMREIEQLSERTWGDYLSNSRVLDLYNRQVTQNENLVDQYFIEFELAARSLLDLLVAEAELYRSRVGRVNARATLILGTYVMQATQSQLASSFGVTSGSTLAGQAINATGAERPLDIIRKGRPVVQDR